MTPASEILKDYEGLILIENNEFIYLRTAMEKIYSEWPKKKYPLDLMKFKSVAEYRERLFSRLRGEDDSKD